jgi:hypothetical protein
VGISFSKILGPQGFVSSCFIAKRYPLSGFFDTPRPVCSPLGV